MRFVNGGEQKVITKNLSRNVGIRNKSFAVRPLVLLNPRRRRDRREFFLRKSHAPGHLAWTVASFVCDENKFSFQIMWPQFRTKNSLKHPTVFITPVSLQPFKETTSGSSSYSKLNFAPICHLKVLDNFFPVRFTDHAIPIVIRIPSARYNVSFQFCFFYLLINIQLITLLIKSCSQYFFHAFGFFCDKP